MSVDASELVRIRTRTPRSRRRRINAISDSPGTRYGVDDDELALRFFDRCGNALPHEPPRLLPPRALALSGSVVGDRRLRPDERQLAGQHLDRGACVLGSERTYSRSAIFSRCAASTCATVCRAPPAIGLPSGSARDRNRETIVPVEIEALRQRLHHGPDDRQVEVAELDLGARLEIRVADVAPTGDRDGVVADEELVVHPVIEAPAADDELGPAKQRQLAPHDERIENADLDIRMRCQRPNLGIAVEGLRVVEQQPHANAAIGGPQQRFEQQLAGVVLPQQEILHVERALGLLGDLQVQRESVGAVDQQAKTGQTLIGILARGNTFSERCLAGIGKRRRRRLRAVHARRQARASGAQQCATPPSRLR